MDEEIPMDDEVEDYVEMDMKAESVGSQVFSIHEEKKSSAGALSPPQNRGSFAGGNSTVNMGSVVPRQPQAAPPKVESSLSKTQEPTRPMSSKQPAPMKTMAPKKTEAFKKPEEVKKAARPTSAKVNLQASV
jgi:hypothetical protein